MKTPTIPSTVVFFATLACLFGTAGAALQDAALAEIRTQSHAFMAAVERGDAAAAAEIFTLEAKLSVSISGGVVSGRKGIASFWQTAVDGGLKSLVLTPADFVGRGDVRVETGSYQAFDTNRRKLGQGQYLFAWVKEQGEWKISRDFANADAGPVAAQVPAGAGLPPGYATRFQVLGDTQHDDSQGLTTVYVNELVAAVAEGEATQYPNGSVILMEFADPQRDGEDQLVRDTQGRPLKGSIRRIDAMRRGGGPGTGNVASRAGEWEFSSYRPDGTTLIAPANAEHCAACHLKAGAEKDFVFRQRSWIPARTARLATGG